jgi:inosine-uridine nucleoside N-ribohydrolase
MASSRPPRTALWLDCDPGHDDALAIILAGWHPRARLLGVSTVHGNSPVDKTTTNALNMLHAAGLGFIPVVAGAPKPLLRAPRHCPDIHGASGLDCFDGMSFPPLPAESRPVASAAVNFMAASIRGARAQHKTAVTLVATGCLTNVALLLSVYPDIASDIEKIVIMGGAVGKGPAAATGNTGVGAEFNIQVDPEAAAIVFASEVEIVLVPLDVTHTALVTRGVLERVASGVKEEPLTGPSAAVAEAGAVEVVAQGSAAPSSTPIPATATGAGSAADASLPLAAAATPFRSLLISLLRFFASTYAEEFEMPDPPLHDPCAVLAALEPALFTTLHRRVEIETHSPVCAGATLVDWHGILKRAPNAHVCVAMDVPSFWGRMLDAVAAADAHSPMNGPEDAARAKALLGASLVALPVSPGRPLSALAGGAASPGTPRGGRGGFAAPAQAAPPSTA